MDNQKPKIEKGQNTMQKTTD